MADSDRARLLEEDAHEEEDDFADEIWPRQDLTLLQKTRLFWEEHVVHKKRLPQVYGLVLSVVLVLLGWSILQSSNVTWNSGDQLYDDSAKGLDTDWTNVRLPKHILPHSYKLSLNADVPQFSFDGNVDMTLNITGPTRIVVFHSVALTIGNVTIWKGKSSVKPAVIKSSEKNEYTVLVFSRPLRAGTWNLKASFSGALTDSLRGFYISKVSEVDGISQYIASTQFQPTDARRAFPCLDEPGFKSSFQINITVPPAYSALSNMPEVQRVKSASRTTFVFEETPRISTYLIAYVVSNFAYVEGVSKRGIKVRVYTRPGKKNLGEYALKTAVKLLDFFEATYRVNYPLPKLDLIAIPDFAAGAMENWGLITYRETALLFDEKLSSADNKQRVATVIAHEMAHQWFGNLVTMEWWGDLWLNEGFASFMEYKGVDSLEPSWRMQDQFLNLDYLKALSADSSKYTHSIASEVADPEEIEEIFDDITYAKGASVLRMLEGWIGIVANKTYFFDRISEYLTANAFSNANTSVLWNALDKSSLNIGKIMNSWTSQPGYPVLFVEKEGGRYSIHQQKFSLQMSDVSNSNTSDVKSTWEIPVLVQGYGESGVRIGGPFTSFVSGSGKQAVEDDSAPILMFNFGRKGFFRVMYPIDIWEKLISWSKQGLLSISDRVGLISDAFTLNKVGVLEDIKIPLEFTRTLKDETDFIIWKFFIQEFGVWDSLLAFEPSYGLFTDYQKILVGPLAIKLGWNETDPDVSSHHGRALMRSEILSEAVALGVPEIVDIALEYYHQLKNNSKTQSDLSVSDLQASVGLPADLLNVVWDSGVIYGDETDYKFVLELYQRTTFAVDRDRLMHALASARKQYLIRETLDFTLSGKVRKQDITKFIYLVADLNGPSHVQVWNFLRNRWTDIVAIWAGSDWTQVNNLIQNVVSLFSEPSLIDEARRLFVDKEGGKDWFVPPLAEKAVSKGIELALTRVSWLKRSKNDLHQWLEEFVEGH
ncbi:hypothetical protein HDU67_002999 [Dinochytrium kinnereticum]|nr:hypothetical protein HDU67_002999 [Dinochytrium kinnereticum]